MRTLALILREIANRIDPARDERVLTVFPTHEASGYSIRWRVR